MAQLQLWKGKMVVVAQAAFKHAKKVVKKM
jgi:hypothetical protein